ncbi:MAG: hypothetical protein ACSLFP_10235 [Acidimicrobiales bacterium]
MGKANFDHIYTAADPRPYFQTLGALDYQIPAHGAAVFGALAEQLGEVREVARVRIADLCCSYGINGAVLRHDASFEEIVEHYAEGPAAEPPVDPEEQRAIDRAYFAARRDDEAPEVIGIDASIPAIDYALDVGFLDGGAAEDLEVSDPSSHLVELLEPTDLVTVTGGIGYITERTVGRVLDAATETPWVAALCLRWVDFDAIAEMGIQRGMTVHHLPEVTFPQRRFSDVEEAEFVLKELDRLGIDSEGAEEEGYHHAELYLLQPPGEELPVALPDLVPAPSAELPLLDTVSGDVIRARPPQTPSPRHFACSIEHDLRQL